MQTKIIKIRFMYGSALECFHLRCLPSLVWTLELATSYGLMDWPSTEWQNSSFPTFSPLWIMEKLIRQSWQTLSKLTLNICIKNIFICSFFRLDTFNILWRLYYVYEILFMLLLKLMMINYWKHTTNMF